MSPASIDDKVVSMQFDNQAFERNIAATLASINKLQKSLDFANSTRGMNELTNASKKFNLGHMGASIEGASAKFIALTTVGVTALTTLASKAIDIGARVSSAFTFKPVLEGFQEYETNMNSIQTILANTKSEGKNLNDVNAALENLNKYSDQTIYNFSQMARNIGTFTAAGVDLDKSVNSIKGIANLAAISGSNSEQASTAMYQLSQALAAGKVSLMDWNSVVNAGMGGEVFKKALFETGKAMKTITDVPVGASFEEWEKKGGTFREQMQKGWITADVLSTTLSSFSGDLDEAGLKAIGFSDKAAKEMVDLGKLGIAAATEVKTITQLMSTVKESVASGWAQSFKLVVGDFEEAKKLFTGVNKAIGHVVEKSAESRNNMLKDWRKAGGREALIDAFQDAFGVIAPILDRLGKAFRDVFPAMTGQRLTDLIKGFSALAQKITPSRETADKLRDVFRGLFSVIDIGITIVKELTRFIFGILGSFKGAGGGALDLAQKFGIMLQVLNNFLVGEGGIRRFFDMLTSALASITPFINRVISGISNLYAAFSGETALSAVGDTVGRIESRFGSFSTASERLAAIWERLGNVFDGVKRVLDGVWTHIRTWFSELGAKMAEAFGPGDFNAAIDVINVGLLGGIVVLLKKFLSGDMFGNLGEGFFGQVTDILDGLSGKLQAMQANVKADTLMKIAMAVGLLAASVTVLALIDSAALTKALGALAVGVGQLVATMATLNIVAAGPKGAATLAALVAGMIGMAGAMVILSGAIKVLSTIDPGDLASGIAGLTAGLAAMVAAMIMLPPSPMLIASGIAMVGIATSMVVLAGAIKLFSLFSWGDMAKGLVGIGAGLGIMVVAMNLMPVASTLAAGLAMIPLATGLSILAGAVKLFSGLTWGEMAKGMAGLAGALLIIAGTMNLMPINLPITAAGMLILSTALTVMAKAVDMLGSLKMGEIAKGLGALAGMMAILVVSVNLMTGAMAGAAALTVVSGSILVLSKVLQELAKLSLAELAKGIGAIAATLAVLGIAAALLTPVLPAMLALGAAVGLLGAGFALFGTGAYLVSKAFEAFARAGVAGMKAIIEVIKLSLTLIPIFAGALVQAILSFVTELVQAAPLLLKAITVLLVQVLDTVIELVPKIVEALGVIVTGFLTLLVEKTPEIVYAGFQLLMGILKGIRDNVVELTVVAIEVVTLFATTLTNNVKQLVDAAVNLLTGFLKAISDRASDITRAGFDLLLAFIKGIADNLLKVVEAGFDIVIKLVSGITDKIGQLVTAGVDAVLKFIKGISDNLSKVISAGVDVVLSFIKGLAGNALRFAEAASSMLIDFLNALAEIIRQKAPELRKAGGNIASAIIEGMTGGLSSRASDVAKSAIGVATGAIRGVMGAIDARSPSRVFAWIGRMMAQGLALGMDKDVTATNSAVAQAERIVKAFQDTLSTVPSYLSEMDDLSPVITPVLDLTKVRAESRALGGMLATSALAPGVSYSQARSISRSTDLDASTSDAAISTMPPVIKFEQHNHSPKALSTNDIYRNTKSQIALAKEELSIS